MSAALVSIGKKPDASSGRSSQTEIRESAANEFVIKKEASTFAPEALVAILKESRVRQLLEFSRAVHAEMDALLRAAREERARSGPACS